MAVPKNQDYRLLAEDGRMQEEKYDWVSAIELYGNALTRAQKTNDFSQAAEILLRTGFCYYRSAMQAENLQGFKKHLTQAINAYNRAARLLEKTPEKDPAKPAKISHCKALAAYADSWLKPDSASRKKMLDRFWELQKEALEFYKQTDDRLNIARTYNELNTCLVDRLDLEWDKGIRRKELEEALGYGDEAITILPEQGEEYELGRAYCTTSIIYHSAALGFEQKNRRQYEQKALDYSERAVEISQRIGDSFLLGMSHIAAGSAISDFTDHQDIAAKHFETALQCGVSTKDNYLIGRASYLLAFSESWKMFAEEDPDKKREESEKCKKHCEDSIRHFSTISYDRGIASSYYWYAENFNISATSIETSLEGKCILLKKSIEAARKGLEHARHSGSIGATWFILHPLSKALFMLSTLEINTDVKRPLLEESLRYRDENIKALEQAMPYHFWNRGVYDNYRALIQAELAEIERETERKVKLLQEAVESVENGIKLCSKHETLSRGKLAALGRYYSDFGRILNQLYRITNAHELLGKLIEVSKGTIETYEKADLPSRVPEGYWQLAKAHDKLHNYPDSAESFKAASKGYKVAAERLPQLKDFYSDFAAYMQAWSNIEKARQAHISEEYEESKKCYRKAASLHNSTKLWKYLSSNYSAWAQLENGEDQSRKNQSRNAIKAFKRAAGLFEKAKEEIDAELDKIQNADETAMATGLSAASDLRRKYSLGRIIVEEAKILDREGTHISSSKKYGLAVEMFEEIAKAILYESERKELRQIIYLCQAWQKMTLAEAEASSNLYLEAAELFEKAKEYSISEKARVLGLANSSFCRALEAGARFEATRDRRVYLTATQHLESAAGFYVKAGFRSASEYAKATQRLLDAYAYVDDAKKERDVEKKAQYYFMAEKMLEASVDSYLKAKHPQKSDEAQRLLDDVKDERQLAVSLCRVLHAPPIAATTATLSNPIPTQEEAAGLQRFETADIQASLIISPKEIYVGEDLNFEIEIVNAGNGEASLIKIESGIPQGFELKEKPKTYRFEDHCVNMKGKRLAPLRTDEVKLVLKPKSKGTFILNPRITYLDETGKYRTHEPEPARITVRELGIKGWIEGER
ncbi:MAG: hypothetical protein JSV57_04625 [Candidatus Bathyarchaeota archaeon]|nr:MAG: hypothetical protein JSV57_04625 [Candidatus Bathyarchaeota archaeon]